MEMLTVAICTWNRSSLLARTLEQLGALIVPPGLRWELLVVDNASSDDTSRVLQGFLGRLPMRVVREDRPGLSNARNAAIGEARGEYIIWTDDDVLVDSGWLAAYSDAFERHPEGAFFGGPIRPWFEGSPPAWLEEGLRAIGGAYALRDFAAGTERLDDKHLPFGANFAVRSSVQRNYPFDTALGRQRAQLLSGEETSAMRAMLQDGYTGYWVADAAVQHFIPENRQNLSYLRAYFRGSGRGRVVKLGPEAVAPPPFGVLRLLKRVASAEIRYRIVRARGTPVEYLGALAYAASTQGQCAEYFRRIFASART